MKVLNNVDLKMYTTVKIGGTAQKMFVPDTVEELENVVKNEKTIYFIGGGSNLLINDREFDSVINLRNFNKVIEDRGEGKFHVGASVHLQELITVINEAGYGGIEYLISVPGLVGGAIVMNAGRGRQYNQAISDYVTRVTVLKEGKIAEISKAECNFAYRNSKFKNNEDYIIIAADFLFPKQSKEESCKLRKERIEFCKKNQDNSAPNFGTVFMDADRRIMKLTKRLRVGKGAVKFSGKTANWILNMGDGSYKEAISAIKKVERLHYLFGKKCKTEVIKWE